jgi:hypothetical protein
MVLFNIILIVLRVLCGLCAIGFILGMHLNKKYPIFETIFIGTGTFAIIYGVFRMFVFAILGK